MEVKLTPRATLGIMKKTNSDDIAFDLYSNDKCFDLQSAKVVEIINELLAALEIRSRVVTRNRYEIETI